MSEDAHLRPAKAAVDVGVVISDSAKALTFYRDILGLVHEGDVPMSGGVMHRLQIGDSIIKLTCPKPSPSADARPPQSGLMTQTGLRYFTIHVTDIDAVVARCVAGGAPIVLPVTEARPGVRIAMVADPDSNVIEFAQFDEVRST